MSPLHQQRGLTLFAPAVSAGITGALTSVFYTRFDGPLRGLRRMRSGVWGHHLRDDAHGVMTQTVLTHTC